MCANAGLDRSNAGGRIVRLPEDPDGWASEMRRRAPHEVAVVVSDTVGRAFRRGAVGTAIGVAGLAPLVDLTGRTDLDGRAIEHSEVPLADIVAAAADLVMGQTDEGVPAAVVRGVSWAPSDEAACASALQRPAETDLYV